jgi:thiamine-monophosphate kinase
VARTATVRTSDTNREEVITVGELGEFGLIAAVTAAMAAASGQATAADQVVGSTLLLGPGDDAAVLRTVGGRVVATTDMLIEGRHFRRDWSSAADIGHKAAARNLADVAAMGAVPTALLVGFAGPDQLAVEWVTDLAAGIAAECAAVGAAVAGGDTSSAETVLLAITALGDLAGRDPVTRGGARPGDVVAVAGTLGSAAAGLDLLIAGAALDSPDLADLVGAHRRPSPPYSAGPQAAALGATSLIDVSDGLVADVGHVALASSVRIELELRQVAAEPIARAGALAQAAKLLGRPDWVNWVLTGGDDHALVATFPADVELPAAWTTVGSVAKGHGVAIDGDVWSGAGGWEHFRA